MKSELTNNDLKNYIKSYIEDRKITYTRLDKHDRGIIVILNENKELQQRIDKALNYIYKNYGVLDKYQIEILETILKGE